MTVPSTGPAVARLESLLPTPADIARAEERIRAFASRPLYIYGAGVYAREVFRFLQGRGVSVAGYCVDDQFAGKGGDAIAMSALGQIGRDVNVVVGFCGDFARAERALRSREIAGVKEILHLDCRFWERFATLTEGSIRTRLDEFAAVYGLFQDPLSQRTFVEYLRTKLLFDARPLRALASAPQYFPDGLPAFHPIETDVFVDGGAFTGDTLASLLASGTVSRIRGYHGFEPDEQNAQRLAASLAGMPVSHATVHRAGLWSVETTVRFTAHGNTTSSIVNTGGEALPTETIDAQAPDATFIKLDIEGAEVEALKGAAATIATGKPRLAIAVYHSPADLLDVPGLIVSLRSDYAFALRIHSFMSEELVMYAR